MLTGHGCLGSSERRAGHGPDACLRLGGPVSAAIARPAMLPEPPAISISQPKGRNKLPRWATPEASGLWNNREIVSKQKPPAISQWIESRTNRQPSEAQPCVQGDPHRYPRPCHRLKGRLVFSLCRRSWKSVVSLMGIARGGACRPYIGTYALKAGFRISAADRFTRSFTSSAVMPRRSAKR
jgi:hypothetical protein